MTIFEKIINREIPSTIIYEDEEVLAFRDITPQSPTHILVVPKKVIATTNDLTESDTALIGKLVQTAVKVAKSEGIAESGYRLVMNCNEDGGQSVDHIHVHLLGGRKMHWPPG